jgi:hypothetical protein
LFAVVDLGVEGVSITVGERQAKFFPRFPTSPENYGGVPKNTRDTIITLVQKRGLANSRNRTPVLHPPHFAMGSPL